MGFVHRMGRALRRLVAVAVLAAAGQAAQAGALDAAMDAVLVVRSADAEDRFLGSAFLWGADGAVAVTNAHVVGEAATVRLVDRHGAELQGEVIAVDPVRDVAVIGLPGAPRRGLVPGDAPAVLGDAVFALGAPLGIEFTLTEGLVSATGRQVEPAVPLHLLQHDAAVNPGSSGGPLVDAAGRLVGMNSRIADGSRMFVGIAYAITAAALDRIVTGLIDETLAPFPALGLTARPVDRKVAAALGVDPGGLLVDAAAPGGLAEAAGLRAGDILLALDGARLAAPGDLAFLIEAALPEGKAALTVRRDGQDLALVLEFAPEQAAPAGLRLRELTLAAAPEKVASYRLGALGVVLDDEGRVTELTDNSPAIFAGLSRGDRILAVNGTAMDAAALRALEITGPVLLRIAAPDGATRHLYLDPWGASDGARPVGGANVLDPAVLVF